jgi:hypothetical protein
MNWALAQISSSCLALAPDTGSKAAAHKAGARGYVLKLTSNREAVASNLDPRRRSMLRIGARDQVYK